MSSTKEKSPLVLAHDEGLNLAGVSCNQEHNSKSEADCQSDNFVFPGIDSEIKDKFTPKKKLSLTLSDSYERLGFNSKSLRVADCGSYLEFSYSQDSFGVLSDSHKLFSANFCRDRMCPMCSWRRSYKIFGQVSQIMDVIGSDYKFLFLTLTVRNCSGADLNKTLDRMMAAWRKFIRYKDFKIVRGFFRALEITRNNDFKSKSFGTYHPHFHAVLAVPKRYGKEIYISRDRWLELWQRAYQDQTITQVDIRLAKQKDNDDQAVKQLSSMVAEIAKYTVKASDYLFPGNNALTDSVVSCLSSALFHRRLVAYGGVFQDTFEKLRLDDPEDGDLVHLNDTINPAVAHLIVRYGWSCGIYKITSCRIELPREEVSDGE